MLTETDCEMRNTCKDLSSLLRVKYSLSLLRFSDVRDGVGGRACLARSLPAPRLAAKFERAALPRNDGGTYRNVCLAGREHKPALAARSPSIR